MATFDLLCAQHQIPLLEHYHYIQIRHFYTSHHSLPPSSSPTPFEQICHDSPRGKGLMSTLYKTALASYFSDALPYQSKWETDCNEKFTPEDWGTMLQNLRKATKSLTVRETAYKVLTRWYYTPSRPQMMFPGTSGLCFRGCQLPGTFRHIFWNCRLLSLVWKGVTAVVSAIAGTPLQLTVSMVLL